MSGQGERRGGGRGRRRRGGGEEESMCKAGRDEKRKITVDLLYRKGMTNIVLEGLFPPQTQT